MASAEDHTPHPVDVHVGAQVRIRRKLLGVSQEALADKLGLTFQQVQKYERGANRISASKLYDIARALDAEVSSFFLGLPTSGSEPLKADSESFEIINLFAASGGVQIAKLFTELRHDQRMGVVNIVRAIAEMTPPDDRAIAA